MSNAAPIFLLLSAGAAAGVAADVSAAPDRFPKEVNGLPAFYYWRQSIRDGDFKHPAEGWTLSVDAARRSKWERTFRRMSEAGVRVPVYSTHNPAGDPAKTLGWVVDVRQNGPWLEELHQYLGESARDTALKNFVSLGIDEHLRDGSGRNWGEAIFHSAIVPDPIVSGQGGAVRYAASGGARRGVYLSSSLSPQKGDTDMQIVLTDEQQASLRTLLGVTELKADGAAALIVSKLTEGNGASVKLASLTTEHTTLKGELQAANVKLLSAGTPKLPDPETLEGFAEADEERLSRLTREGKVSPVAAKLLGVALIRGEDKKLRTFSLAKSLTATDVRISRAVLDALDKNTPALTGGSSTTKQLSTGGGGGGKTDTEADPYSPEEWAKRNSSGPIKA